MTQETIVRLKILSETRSPESITTMIGLKCDRSWHPGDLRRHTTIIEKNNGWILHSGLPRAASLDMHLDALWRLLEPAKKRIHDLSMTETIELSIVIYSESVPALYFTRSTIDRLGELGADLDIDLYVTQPDA